MSLRRWQSQSSRPPPIHRGTITPRRSLLLAGSIPARRRSSRALVRKRRGLRPASIAEPCTRGRLPQSRPTPVAPASPPVRLGRPTASIAKPGGGVMAKDHGSSVKNDKQYEGLRKKGMSKGRAAAISNSPGSSSRGGKSSGSGGGSSQSRRSSGRGSGGNRAQKAAAGRKGGKKSS